MKDRECTAFLQWCLPRLRLRWPGFRKVRRQVCKRLGRRLGELGITGLAGYERFLERHPEEWDVLDSLCRITISRFYRDRGVFDELRLRVLPALLRKAASGGVSEVRCWSAGCGAGEEPYTLQIIWKLSVRADAGAGAQLRITATDADGRLLERARAGRYPGSSLKDFPRELLGQAFARVGDEFAVRKAFTENVEFREEDIRVRMPEGRYHLVLCRNMVFTYFAEELQKEMLEGIAGRLLPGGLLVLGIHESLPEAGIDMKPLRGCPCIFLKGENGW